MNGSAGPMERTGRCERAGKIDKFEGDYRFLSNFWTGHPVIWRDWRCPSAEHLFQARKTRVADVALAYAIATDPDLTPMGAKRAGRRLALRPDWEEVKLAVMRDVLAAKFAPHSSPADLLLATGDAVLIEGNHWGDRFWGVCGGRGQNWLGHLLMARRAELRAMATERGHVLPDQSQLPW